MSKQNKNSNYLFLMLFIIGISFISISLSFVKNAKSFRNSPGIQLKINLSSPSLVSSGIFSFNSYSFPGPEIKNKGNYKIIEIEGLENQGEAGVPLLPSKTFFIGIPYNEELKDIKITTQDKETIKDVLILPAPHPKPLLYKEKKNENPFVFEKELSLRNKKLKTSTLNKERKTFLVEELNGENTFLERDPEIYNSSQSFPGGFFQYNLQKKKGYKILILKFYPLQYIPSQKEIYYYKKFNLAIVTSSSSNANIASQEISYRGLEKDKEEIRNLIINPSILDSCPPQLNVTQGSVRYDWVLISSNELLPSFSPLVNWRIQKGMPATAVAISDIYTNYPGTDDQEKIRNFAKYAYNNWQTKYILLGGDTEIIPTRGVYGSVGSYISRDMPSDMYYGNLDGTWNYDEDDLWGEYGDGTGGGEIDLLGEIYIGRAPVNTPLEVENFVNKTISFETNLDALYLKNGTLVGEVLDPWTEGGVGKDMVAENLSQFNITKLYERDGNFSWNQNLKLFDEIDKGIQFINHIGHAYELGVMGMYTGNVTALTNNDYFWVYTVGCYTNAFDGKGAYTQGRDSISETFVNSTHAAVAFIGNSRYGWYYPGFAGKGPGEKFDQEFFKKFSNENIVNIGKTLQFSREALKENVGFTGAWRWTYLNLNLLGDPALEMVATFTSPIVKIHLPETQQILTGSAEIWATIEQGKRLGSSPLESYKIEYSLNSTPFQWTTTGITLLAPQGQEISRGLIARLNTLFISDGEYVLRLTARNINGEEEEHLVSFVVENIKITSPLNNDILPLNFPIEGVLYYSSGSFEIKVGQGKNPSQWLAAGVNLSNNGLLPLPSSVLGTWNASGLLTSPAIWSIKIKVHSDAISEKTFWVWLDPLLKQNWPKRGHREWLYPPLVEDFNNDGIKEIMTFGREKIKTLGESEIAKIYLWNINGNLLPGWPLQISLPARDKYIHPSSYNFSAGDIDNDGNKEIVFYTRDGRIFAYNYDGSVVPGFPFQAPEMLNDQAALVLADLNLDGTLEIIVTTYSDHYLYVFNNQGEILPGWPYYYRANIHDGFQSEEPSPAVGNFDDDPELEIVIGTHTETRKGIKGIIYMINFDGTNVPGWPRILEEEYSAPAFGYGYFASAIFSSLAAGDINQDGSLEIIVSSDSGMYVLDKTGEILSGWPQIFSLYDDSNIQRIFASASPALADFDNDGNLEIVGVNTTHTRFVDTYQNVYVWRHTGEIVPGWPKRIENSQYPNKGYGLFTGDFFPIIGNIDEDEAPEIIAASFASDYDFIQINAWNFDGSEVLGFPRLIEQSLNPPIITITDIDGDGDAELLTLSDWDFDFEKNTIKNRNSIYLWDFPVPYNPRTTPWPTLHHDFQNTGLYGPPVFGPHLIIEKKETDDRLGDGDSLVEPGEKILLNIILKNFSLETKRSVQALLTTTAQTVQIITSSASFGDIPSMATASASSLFNIAILPFHSEGFVRFKLIITDNQGYHREEGLIIKIDLPILKGFPFSGIGAFKNIRSPILEDLDNDGSKEIVTFTENAGTISVLAINFRGEIVSGWPQELGNTTDGKFAPSKNISIGDVDKDGKKEMIVPYLTLENSQYYLNVIIFSNDGVKEDFWRVPVTLSGSLFLNYYPALADLDKDDDLEIIVVFDFRSQVFVFHHDGTPYPGWPQTLPIESTFKYTSIPPVIGDLDNNGTIEIGVQTYLTGDQVHFFFYNSNGTLFSEWASSQPWKNFTTEGQTISQLILGDVDNDKNLEAALAVSDSQIYLFHHNGQIVSGWPQGLGREVTFVALAFGDANQDGFPEIAATWTDVAGTAGVTLFSSQGVKIWEKLLEETDVWGFPLFANLDSDESNLEILVSPASRVYAWSFSGNFLSGVAFSVPSEISGFSIVVGDLDGNNEIELIKEADHYLYAWDLEAKEIREGSWHYWHHDAYNTGNYNFVIQENLSPVLSPLEDKTIRVAETLSFVINAFDLNNDPLVFFGENLPSGAAIFQQDETSALFSWTPEKNQAGIYPEVRFIASDGVVSTSQEITIAVLANQMPRVSFISPEEERWYKKMITIAAQAFDDDGFINQVEFEYSLDSVDGITGTWIVLPGSPDFIPPYALSWQTKPEKDENPSVWLKVRAKDNDGDYSSWVSRQIKIDNKPPSKPIGLRASSGNSQVDLSWSANTEEDLAGYKIYRALTLEGPYDFLSTPNPATATVYSDLTVTNGVTYYYKINAYDDLNNISEFSDPSNPATPQVPGGGGGGGGGYVFLPDVTPPTDISISINEGAKRTISQNVTLTLKAREADWMMISNDPKFTNAIWETYTSEKSWLLVPEAGIKTVYAKFKDKAGNVSKVVSGTIELIPPEIPSPEKLKRREKEEPRKIPLRIFKFKRNLAKEQEFVKKWQGFDKRMPTSREIQVGVYGIGRNLAAEIAFVKKWGGKKGRLPNWKEILAGVYYQEPIVIKKRNLAKEQEFVRNWQGLGGKLPTFRQIQAGVYGIGRNLSQEIAFVQAWKGKKDRLPTHNEIIAGVY